MSRLDDVPWSQECRLATDGKHKDELFNERGPWDCYQWIDGQVGDRCEITWALPGRCEDSEFRCLPTECVNSQDLQSMANEIYHEIQERVCSLESRSAQDCQCCCEKELEVSIVCDWVRKQGNVTEIIERQKLVTYSNIVTSSSETDVIDVNFWVGLTLTFSAFIILAGWALLWYFSPRRKGYNTSDPFSDQLPPPSSTNENKIRVNSVHIHPKSPPSYPTSTQKQEEDDEEDELRGPPTIQGNEVTEIRQRKKRVAFTSYDDDANTTKGENKEDIINNEIAFMLEQETKDEKKEKRDPSKKKKKKKRKKSKNTKNSVEIELNERNKDLSPVDDEETTI